MPIDERTSNQELIQLMPDKVPRIAGTQRRNYAVMTNVQLVAFSEYCRRNMVNHDEITYDGAMKRFILPELLRRIQALMSANLALCAIVDGSVEPPKELFIESYIVTRTDGTKEVFCPHMIPVTERCVLCEEKSAGR